MDNLHNFVADVCPAQGLPESLLLFTKARFTIDCFFTHIVYAYIISLTRPTAPDSSITFIPWGW